jgi:hypothetical protein
MLLRGLKQSFVIPDKELIINKVFEARGRDAVLAALTEQDGRQQLWCVYTSPNQHHELLPENAAYRERLLLLNRGDPPIFMTEMLIKGHQITFGSTEYRHQVFHDAARFYLPLQYLTERGVDLSVFDNIDESKLVIAVSDIRNGVPFEDLTPIMDSDIRFTIPGDSRPRPIGQDYELPLDTDLADIRRTYTDADGVEQGFYINRVTRYDIWKEYDAEDAKGELVARMREDMKNNNFGDGQIEEMLKGYYAQREAICPRGFDLAIVEYETEDDRQLQFYHKDVLDSELRSIAGGAASHGYGTEKGPHGFLLQTCTLNHKPIPRDFSGKLTVELFAHHIVVPPETIII